MLTLATGLLLGLLLGMRHALEPDHLAAVSVLVTRQGNAAAGAILGAIWGVGHSLALLSVGCILAAIGSRLPPRVADGFELLVGVMLVTLGIRAVLRPLVFGMDHARRHDHLHRHATGTNWGIMRQPLIIGLIHGLAGSGALTALAIASLPSIATRLIYIALFGIGSVIGMACLTGLAGWPLSHLKANGSVSRWLSAATGVFSLVLGSAWGWTALHGLIHG